MRNNQKWAFGANPEGWLHGHVPVCVTAAEFTGSWWIRQGSTVPYWGVKRAWNAGSEAVCDLAAWRIWASSLLYHGFRDSQFSAAKFTRKHLDKPAGEKLCFERNLDVCLNQIYIRDLTRVGRPVCLPWPKHPQQRAESALCIPWSALLFVVQLNRPTKVLEMWILHLENCVFPRCSCKISRVCWKNVPTSFVCHYLPLHKMTKSVRFMKEHISGLFLLKYLIALYITGVLSVSQSQLWKCLMNNFGIFHLVK